MNVVRYKGVIRGKRVELERAHGLPDGQEVTVTLHPSPTAEGESAEEGLRRSFGAWADAGEDLDRFLDQLRQDRRRSRSDADQ